MKQDKALSMLGLAARAKKVASGEFSVEKAVKSAKAYLVITALEASDNTKKKFQNMCEYYQVPMKIYGTKEQLGSAIGKEMRASVAVLDENFANAVIQKMETTQTCNQVMEGLEWQK